MEKKNITKKNNKKVENKKEIKNKDIKKKQINTNEDIKIKDILKEKYKHFNKATFHSTEMIFIVLLTSIISLIFGYVLNNKEEPETDEYIDEIVENYKYISDNYYEEVNKSKLVSGAIDGMTRALDDEYSKLLEQDSSSTFNINLEGTYEGVGIEIVNDEDNNIIVVGVIEDSPAEKAGIQSGDIVKKIDNLSLENSEISKLTKYVQENKNNEYKLLIERDGKEQVIIIERKQITIKSILSKVFEQNNHKIGYIYISVFANATVEQFENALKELEEENIDSLIIDVRENTGGHLTTASDIISNFVSSDKVIYQMEKNGTRKKYYSTGTTTKQYPIVIIQNGRSASASELFSSSMKEAYGATIVGDTSYGKGTVQEMVSLKNGDSYKFTTKKWLTPNGKSINKKGVKPDIEISLSSIYSENPSDETDDQLQAAIKYLTK